MIPYLAMVTTPLASLIMLLTVLKVRDMRRQR